MHQPRAEELAAVNVCATLQLPPFKGIDKRRRVLPPGLKAARTTPSKNDILISKLVRLNVWIQK